MIYQTSGRDNLLGRGSSDSHKILEKYCTIVQN